MSLVRFVKTSRNIYILTKVHTSSSISSYLVVSSALPEYYIPSGYHVSGSSWEWWTLRLQLFFMIVLRGAGFLFDSVWLGVCQSISCEYSGTMGLEEKCFSLRDTKGAYYQHDLYQCFPRLPSWNMKWNEVHWVTIVQNVSFLSFLCQSLSKEVSRLNLHYMKTTWRLHGNREALYK